MNKELSFRCVAYDTSGIPNNKTGKGSIDYFVNTNESAQSICRDEEKQLIRWFFRQTLLKKLFFKETDIDKALPVKLEVTTPIIINPNKKPGDIDILICGKDNPNSAVAIQGKRIKAVADVSSHEKVNKIGDVRNAILQANAMREIGFYKSYLALFIEVDGRARQQDTNFFFNGMADQNFKRVYDFPNRDKLHNDVGVIFIEIVQPIDKSINRSGIVCICVDKKAKLLSQPANLTNRIVELFKE